MIQEDVPSPIDLRDMHDARQWESTAMLRPFREDFFAAFTNEILNHQRSNSSGDVTILDLGSGPGFLADYILSRTLDVHLTLLDFSEAMHELASQRLGADNNRVQYLLRDFKANGWSFGIDQVDIVVTNQAVHELRHKRYALDFFIQIRDLLKRDGVLLYSDHYSGDGGLGNEQLYLRRTEQWAILELAGYKVAEVLVKGGRALYRALPTYSNS